MDSVFTATVAMETEVMISDGAGCSHQLAPLSALGGDVHGIDLFRNDGESSLRYRRLGITNGDRPNAKAAIQAVSIGRRQPCCGHRKRVSARPIITLMLASADGNRAAQLPRGSQVS